MGIVSVGYLTSYLETITVSKVVNILIAAVLLLLALLSSRFFTRSIKKQIFSPEPRDWSAGAPAEGDDGVHL